MSNINRRHYSESGIVRCQASHEAESIRERQLSLEKELQRNCQDLLHLYKESQDWPAVGQLAQSLVTNSSRISELKQHLNDPPTQLPYLEKIVERSPEPRPRFSTDPQAAVGTQENTPIIIRVEHPDASLPRAFPSEADNIPEAKPPQASSSCPSKGESPVGSDSEELSKTLCWPEFSESNNSDQFSKQGSHHDRCCSEAASVSDSEVSPGEERSAITTVSPHHHHTLIEQLHSEGDLSPTDQRSHNDSPHEQYVLPAVIEEGRVLEEVNEIGDLDKIENLMETLADQFSDMNKEMESADTLDDNGEREEGEIEEEQEEVTVPSVYKPTDASSDGSEQFYSPRDSISSELGASEEEEEEIEGKETEHFEDAESFPTWRDCEEPPWENERVFSVSRVSPGKENPTTESTQHRGDFYFVEPENTELVSRLFEIDMNKVVHNYSEFIHLYGILTSHEHGSLNCQFETFPLTVESRDDGDFPPDASKDLELFLNHAASSPALCRMSVFVDFLMSSSRCWTASADVQPACQGHLLTESNPNSSHEPRLTPGSDGSNHSGLSPEPVPVVKELTPESEPVVKELTPEPLPVVKELTPAVVKELSPEPVPVVKELSPEPVPVVKELTPEPVPVVKELSPEPVPEVKELTPEPVPVVKELTPEPVPVVKELTPEPVPVVKELSPEPVPVVKELTPEPVPVLKELTPEPVPVVKELTPEPVPVVKELSPEPVPVVKELTPEPVPVLKELTPEPVPVVKELTPEPVPVVKELTPEHVPVVKELTPEHVPVVKELTPEPVPVVKELTPEPVPVVKELSPEPVPVVKELTPEPVPVVKELTPEPVPVVKELTPELVHEVKELSPEPIPVVKELISEPVPEVKELSPEPVPVVKELTPEPVPEVKELSPEPVPVMKELTPEPVPVVKELTPEPVPVVKDLTPEPVPEVKELSPEPVPVVKELTPEPVPVVKELTPEPVPVVKELSPEPIRVMKELSPEPVPVVKELSPEPVPVVKELTPEPVPEVKELSPEPVPVMKELTPEPVPVVKELSPEPVPVVKELTPEPVPVVKELSPEPVPVVKELSPEPVPVMKELTPEPVPVVKELSPEPVPVMKELTPEPVPVVKELSPEPVPVVKELTPEPVLVVKELSPIPEVKGLSPEPATNINEQEKISLSALTFEPGQEMAQSLQIEEHKLNPSEVHLEEEVEEAGTQHQRGGTPSRSNTELEGLLSGNIKESLDPIPRTELENLASGEANPASLLQDTAMSDKSKIDVLPPESSAAQRPASGDRSELVSPSHSDRLLESSTTSSASTDTSCAAGTDTSSADPSSSGGGGSSPEKLSNIGSRSMSLPKSEGYNDYEKDGALHMSMMSASEAKNKTEKGSKRKRQGSMHNFILNSKKSIKGKIQRAASQHERQRRKPLSETQPSLMKAVMTQDWDPTCLLEELYSDFRPSSRATVITGESARHYGYLEKLPKNATKSSVLKGWKRRYFRVMEDKVLYYEDRTSPKPLGFVHLSISRIVHIPEKNQIQILEKAAQSIMLKACNKEETNEWYRALLLEAAHPTLSVPIPTSPLSLNQEEQSFILIIDIGAASVRAGFGGKNAYPEMFFPAVASIDASNFESINSGNLALLPDNRYGSYQVYPRRHNLRMDKASDSNLEIKALECIINLIVSDLNVDPQSTDVILTLPPTTAEQERNELVEILFEVFLFSSICFQDQCHLSLYSYNTTSGIVVNLGDHIDVVPIIDGYSIEAGVSRLPHGGNAITEYLTKLITNKGIRYFSETENYIVRLIKEELCYVSQAFEEDMENCDRSPATYTRATDLDRFQLPDHRKVVALDLECFKAPEGLFDPSRWGKDVPGLHELVWKAIQACPIDQRREMSRKIFLSGGTSLLRGLPERLQKELTSMATTGTVVEVHAGPDQQHAAFLGASVLATLGSFQNYLVTREEFNALGFEVLKKWSV